MFRSECFIDELFIETGYRRQLTWGECMQSLFVVHNESGNTWTQIVGFVIFLVLLVLFAIMVLPGKQWLDWCVWIGYLYSVTQGLRAQMSVQIIALRQGCF